MVRVQQFYKDDMREWLDQRESLIAATILESMSRTISEERKREISLILRKDEIAHYFSHFREPPVNKN